ncbi:MAG: TonB C-terminal domain-containing protein [Prosthecobacter sp.]|uniref:TonB C-terminal domain-containing protein n=1 Tax=Prosthecobacter sp. TaxID=1965333 RepID=UPI0038FD58A5
MLIIGGLALAGGGYVFTNYKPGKSTPKKKLDMVIVNPVIDPPPPPPMPKKEPLPVEKPKDMIVQPPAVNVAKPVNKTKDEPKSPPLGTAIAGGDGSGLSIGDSRGGSSLIGDQGGNKEGSLWGWYAGTVQSRIADALRGHPLTRRASFSNIVKIWSDATGRITRVKLSSSTGDQAVDNAIENEVLQGLVLAEAPPAGMPMPINLRLSARN